MKTSNAQGSIRPIHISTAFMSCVSIVAPETQGSWAVIIVNFRSKIKKDLFLRMISIRIKGLLQICLSNFSNRTTLLYAPFVENKISRIAMENHLMGHKNKLQISRSQNQNMIQLKRNLILKRILLIFTINLLRFQEENILKCMKWTKSLIYQKNKDSPTLDLSQMLAFLKW